MAAIESMLVSMSNLVPITLRHVRINIVYMGLLIRSLRYLLISEPLRTLTGWHLEIDFSDSFKGTNW